MAMGLETILNMYLDCTNSEEKIFFDRVKRLFENIRFSYSEQDRGDLLKINMLASFDGSVFQPYELMRRKVYGFDIKLLEPTRLDFMHAKDDIGDMGIYYTKPDAYNLILLGDAHYVYHFAQFSKKLLLEENALNINSDLRITRYLELHSLNLD